jgi:outer membrane immunogenic protein
MNKLLPGTLLLAAFGLSGAAVADTQSWSGFYVGVNAGGGWSEIQSTVTPVGATSVSDFTSHELNHQINGGIFGMQGGYNWQYNRYVVGIEGGFDGASISGSRHKEDQSMLNPGPGGAINGYEAADTINRLASVVGRIGYVGGSGMLYVTGGPAWEKLTRTSMVNAEVAPAVYGVTADTNTNNTRTGYEMGIGYEWMLTQNLLMHVENSYYHFHNSSLDSATFGSCAVAGCGYNVSTRSNNVETLRLGLNFKY